MVSLWKVAQLKNNYCLVGPGRPHAMPGGATGTALYYVTFNCAILLINGRNFATISSSFMRVVRHIYAAHATTLTSATSQPSAGDVVEGGGGS